MNCMMVLSRLFNTTSFRVARRLTTLTRTPERTQRLFQQVKPIIARRTSASSPYDISSTQAVMFLVLGGLPIGLMGYYITKTMKDLIESVEAGEIFPLTKVSNDEWYEMKQKVLAETDEEEEESDEAAASEEPDTPEAENECVVIETLQEQEPAINTKDTVIFIGPPDEE